MDGWAPASKRHLYSWMWRGRGLFETGYVSVSMCMAGTSEGGCLDIACSRQGAPERYGKEERVGGMHVKVVQGKGANNPKLHICV